MSQDCQAFNEAGQAFGWQTTPVLDCCNAPGVTCNADKTRITQLVYKGGQKNSVDGFAKLASMASLVHLDLNDVNFDGQALPDVVGNITSLQYLLMKSCNLKGPIPDTLGNLRNLEYLYMPYNQLSGHVPDIFDGMQELAVIDLGVNKLSGPLPASIFRLSNLNRLHLAFNSLDGTVPSEIGQLKSLRRIDLQHNDLWGPLPAELFRLTNLTSVQVQFNQLSGHLAPEIGNLISLQTFDISHNHFTGPVPATFNNIKAWSNEQDCWINDNKLECFVAGLDPNHPCLHNMAHLSACTTAQLLEPTSHTAPTACLGIMLSLVILFGVLATTLVVKKKRSRSWSSPSLPEYPPLQSPAFQEKQPLQAFEMEEQQ